MGFKKISIIEGKVSNLKEEKDKRDNNDFYNKKKEDDEENEEDEYEKENDEDEEDDENEENEDEDGEKYISKVINGLKYSAKYDSNPESAFENVFPVDRKIDKKFILGENNRKEWIKDEYYEKFTESEIKKIWQHPHNNNKFKNLPSALETNIQNATAITAKYNSSIIEKMLKKDGVYEKRAIEILGTYSNYFSTSKGSFLSFYKKNDDFPNQTLHRFFKHLFKALFDFGEYLLSDGVIDTMFEEAWEKIQKNNGYIINVLANIYITNFKLFVSDTLEFIYKAIMVSLRYKFVINSDKEFEINLRDIYIENTRNPSFDEIRKKIKDDMGIYDYAHFLIESYTFILVRSTMAYFLKKLRDYNMKNGIVVEYEFPEILGYEDDIEGEEIIVGVDLDLANLKMIEFDYVDIPDEEAEKYYPQIQNNHIYVEIPKYHRKEFKLVDGKYEGVFRMWYRYGGLFMYLLVSNNMKNTHQKLWYSNGLQRREYTYENRKKNGLFREWASNGVLIYEGAYKAGNRDGVHRKWYHDGTLWKESTFKDGKLGGVKREWYDNGRLKLDITYKDGRMHGYYEKYRTDGTQEVECTYIHGWRHGFYETYDEEGQVKETLLYKYNVRKVLSSSKN